MIQTYQITIRRDVGDIVSFRLNEKMKQELDRVAKQKGFTRSELLRVATETYLNSWGFN